MKTMTVEKLKTHFSEVLNDVQKGNRIGILFGKNKKPVAMIVPFDEEKKSLRTLGLLADTVQFTIHDDELTAEELISIDDELSS